MWRVRTEEDAQAFAELVSRWQGPIQGLCTRMLGNRHRGEDLAQETFARLYARRHSYEPTGKFSTFLWRIALNICYDELRKIKRRREFSLDGLDTDDGHGSLEFEADDPGPDARLVENERAEAVRQALLQLPEPYRVVVVLRHYEGLKFREIGDVVGIPEGTVKSRMSEALSQLGRLLNPLRPEMPKNIAPLPPESLLI
jgi:RNA polymerase sigma-70 factor (ECF subfamily)